MLSENTKYDQLGYDVNKYELVNTTFMGVRKRILLEKVPNNN